MYNLSEYEIAALNQYRFINVEVLDNGSVITYCRILIENIIKRHAKIMIFN